MTVELFPCSKCRRVPQILPFGTLRDIWCARCELMVTNEPASKAIAEWNRLHGSPLTLAEMPQDVPAWGTEHGQSQDGAGDMGATSGGEGRAVSGDSRRERAKSWDATLREWVPRSSEAMTVGVFTGVIGPITTEYGDAGLLHDRVHVEIGKARAANAVRVPKRCWLHYQPNCALCAEFEPSEGDGVRVVPSAASCVERGRSCADGSVGACSGGVR